VSVRRVTPLPRHRLPGPEHQGSSDFVSTPVGEDGGVELTLDGYGYRWLRVVGPDARRLV
jgi:hypothetical protein